MPSVASSWLDAGARHVRKCLARSSRAFSPIVSVGSTTLVTKLAMRIGSALMADTLLPCSTLRNSFAGLIFIFCLFAPTPKHAQAQQQQRAEGSAGDQLRHLMPRLPLSKHSNKSSLRNNNNNSNDKRGKGHVKNWLQRQTTPKVHLCRPVVLPKASVPPQLARSLHGEQSKQ